MSDPFHLASLIQEPAGNYPSLHKFILISKTCHYQRFSQSIKATDSLVRKPKIDPKTFAVAPTGGLQHNWQGSISLRGGTRTLSTVSKTGQSYRLTKMGGLGKRYKYHGNHSDKAPPRPVSFIIPFPAAVSDRWNKKEIALLKSANRRQTASVHGGPLLTATAHRPFCL